jgi:hypothetical protein
MTGGASDEFELDPFRDDAILLPEKQKSWWKRRAEIDHETIDEKHNFLTKRIEEGNKKGGRGEDPEIRRLIEEGCGKGGVSTVGCYSRIQLPEILPTSTQTSPPPTI